MTNAPTLDPCGCCADSVPQPHLYNRPGLPELAYRIGVQPAFLQRMLARLPMQTLPDTPDLLRRPLADLTTRAADDPAIALLDAWATVADVLTFYQERIANEGFLRTATERRSLLELARLIGYELRPGVAAHTYLQFTVEDASGAPGAALVPAGTKIQSIPAQGQLPQTFETSAPIDARGEWNTLKPRLTQPQTLTTTAKLLYLRGTTTNLKVGDLLLLAVRPEGADPAAAPETKLVRVHRLSLEPELQRTRVDLAADATIPRFTLPTLQRAVINLTPLVFNAAAVNSTIVGQSWSESNLHAFFAIQGWSQLHVRQYLAAPPPPPLPPAETGVFAFRAKVGAFGHNAPRWASLPVATNTKGDPYTKDWDTDASVNITTDSQGTGYKMTKGVDLFLETTVPAVRPGGWIVLDGASEHAYRVAAVKEASLADYALSAKATGIVLDSTTGLTGFRVRDTTIYANSERLELADLPIIDNLTAGDTALVLDRLVLGLAIGQPLALKGERADLPNVIADEVVLLTDIQHGSGITTIAFAPPLAYSYVRATVQLSANVAVATHGETVREVLGSGDGTQSNQRFVLKKPPLTYVAAANSSGAASTLQVRVDGVRWAEVPRVVGLGPRDETYLIRIEDDGKTSVTFGDGERGARLPTGGENVVATYRSGNGFAGMVAAGSLTLLQTRPLGIRGVTNPLPAVEAAEPENRDSARANAPLTVLTLDRIVSLQDFEDFARAFAGIGKAQASAFWRGELRYVHVTIATAAGTPFADDSPLLTNLQIAIAAAADPGIAFRIDTYQPLYFNLKAQLLIDTRYEFAPVRAAVEQAVLQAFTFSERGFGQAVTAAEVVAVIQGVTGVIATDLDLLALVTDDGNTPTGLATRLIAQRARWNEQTGTLEHAQLLLVNPAGIVLEAMTA